MSQAGSDNLELDSAIAAAYSCIDEIQRTLIDSSTGVRRKHSKRFCSPASQSIFQNVVRNLKIRWYGTLGNLFELHADVMTCSKIASYTLEALQTTRDEFNIRDDNYKLVMNCLLTPVIGQLMDEQEMSEESWQRQEGRKHLIAGLISLTSIVRPTEQSCRALRSLEAILIFDILFDALARHAKTVSATSLDIQAQIYHIMNITHLIEIISKKFKEIRIHVSVQLDLGDTEGNQTERKKLLESVQRYESLLLELCQLFDVTSSMSIFRDDLRHLQILAMMLRTAIE